MFKSKEKLDIAVEESKAIRESIEKIASLKDKALLSSVGFQIDSESDLSESESESEYEVQTTEYEDEETIVTKLKKRLRMVCLITAVWCVVKHSQTFVTVALTQECMIRN